nr:hypothetical protein [Escherichia coli]
MRGKEHVEYDNRMMFGMTGLIGFSSGFHTMMNADTLVLLGTQFPYRVFYPTDAKIIQIDINPASIGAHSKVDMALVGDIKSTLRALLPLVEEKNRSQVLDKALKITAMPRKGLDDLAKPSEKAIPRNIWRSKLVILPPMTPSLPVTSARQRYGRHVI